MLTCDFKEEIGYCNYYNESIKGREGYRVVFCKGNADLIGVVTKYNDKGQPYKELFVLWVDADHLQRNYNDDPEFMSHFRFFWFHAESMNDNLWKIAKVLVSNGTSVAIG